MSWGGKLLLVRDLLSLSPSPLFFLLGVALGLLLRIYL